MTLEKALNVHCVAAGNTAHVTLSRFLLGLPKNIGLVFNNLLFSLGLCDFHIITLHWVRYIFDEYIHHVLLRSFCRFLIFIRARNIKGQSETVYDNLEPNKNENLLLCLLCGSGQTRWCHGGFLSFPLSRRMSGSPPYPHCFLFPVLAGSSSAFTSCRRCCWGRDWRGRLLW